MTADAVISQTSLRQLFQFRCGYCGVRESDAGSELTIDHFHPRSRGGTNEPANCVYSCHACNEFKGDYWEPDSLRRLLHPFRDDLSLHLIEEADGNLRPLTETGSIFIAQLRLNRPQLVEYRRERRLLEEARQAETRLIERLRGLDDQLKSVLAEPNELRQDGDIA